MERSSSKSVLLFVNYKSLNHRDNSIESSEREFVMKNIINKSFPMFKLQGVTSDSHVSFPVFSNADLKGYWSVIFSVPLAFTFVCPTEIKSFNEIYDNFSSIDCNIFCFSVDSQFALMEWRKTLGNIKFPLLSDISKSLSNDLDILNEDGVTYRATYIIDPDGIVQHCSINNLNVGRGVDEVLRLVHALQAGGLRQCNWKEGDLGISIS